MDLKEMDASESNTKKAKIESSTIHVPTAESPAIPAAVTSVDVCLQKSYQENRNFNSVYKNFGLIKDAVMLSDKNGNVPIFSFDKENSKMKGAKSFYVSGYERFWDEYRALPIAERCFYETLLPDQLSHLYADVEGCILTNPNVDFSAIYKVLIDEMLQFLKDTVFSESHYHRSSVVDSSIPGGYNIRIIELDSSTPKKFSKHCIIKIENCYFRNNYHCGAFMRQFQKYIFGKYGAPTTGTNQFYIWEEKETEFTNHSKKVFFLDLGVYTLRRQFRLLGSSKRVTPRSPLCIPGKNTLEKRDFFDCLIQYIQDPTKITNVFSVKEPDGSEPFSCSLRTYDDLGNPTSIASNQTARMPISKGQGTISGQSQKRFILTPNANTPMLINEKCTTSTSSGSFYSRGLPISLQDHIKNYIKRVYDYEITSYTINGQKIKLETYDTRCLYKLKMTGITNHKSNHVYFIIDALTKQFSQGCYDEDSCKLNGKKCYTPLGENGRINDRDVVNALNDWWAPADNGGGWSTI